MKILFFDGYCNLCDSLIDWLIRRDKRNLLKFASLQGSTAKEILPQAYRPEGEVNTVLYYREGKIYDRSRAVIKVLQDLGGAWSLMGIFLILPSFILDIGYRFVAKIRYRLFGKKDTCRIPTKAEREKILP